MLIVDLFCGCGGFSTGAVMAGHSVVLAIDSWDTALYVHQHNHPDTVHIQMTLGGDLYNTARLINGYIPKTTKWHLHGSPPCQNLSVANRTSGDSQEGMRLVYWYLDLVAICKPTSWSMEQVTGAEKYLTKDGVHILNTADYMIPQTRKRLYVGKGWTVPRPLGQMALSMALPSLQLEGDLIKGYKNTVAVKIDGHHVGNRKIEDFEGFKTIDEPTYTVCAAGPLKLFKSTRKGPEFVRNLTIRECMTIQGFPKWYHIPENVTKRDSFKMIGNAVSPRMAELITKKIRIS